MNAFFLADSNYVSPLTVVIPESSVDGYLSWNSVPPRPAVYTPAVTMTVFGGKPPFTFAWTRLSGATEISAASPSTKYTNFKGDSTLATFSVSATFEGRVTDSLASTAADTIVVNIARDAY